MKFKIHDKIKAFDICSAYNNVLLTNVISFINICLIFFRNIPSEKKVQIKSQSAGEKNGPGLEP